MTKDVKVVKNIKKSVQVPTAIYLCRNRYILCRAQNSTAFGTNCTTQDKNQSMIALGVLVIKVVGEGLVIVVVDNGCVVVIVALGNQGLVVAVLATGILVVVIGDVALRGVIR